ncbi:MAG TPA: hypothetical protein VLR26_10940 [Frankiaceae bacterium]|nr:hypothetical protein [Frankiaceae bacterium]
MLRSPRFTEQNPGDAAQWIVEATEVGSYASDWLLSVRATCAVVTP